MAISKKHIVKLSEKLAKSIFAPNKRSNYLPKAIALDAVKKSPVFRDPQKWMSKFKLINQTERIQSYRPLQQSCVAHILSAPPRMTHGTRTVVPRSLLLPFRIMRNPFITQDEEGASAKENYFKYIIAPFHPEEKKIPEDPVTYYPRDLTLLQEYPESLVQEVTVLRKYSLNPNLYPNITDWKNVGWNINTAAIVKKISSDEIRKLLRQVPSVTSHDSNLSKVRLIYEPNNEEAFRLQDGFITINLIKITKGNLDINRLFKEKFPLNFIPIDETNLSLIKELFAYCILVY